MRRLGWKISGAEVRPAKVGLGKEHFDLRCEEKQTSPKGRSVLIERLTAGHDLLNYACYHHRQVTQIGTIWL